MWAGSNTVARHNVSMPGRIPHSGNRGSSISSLDFNIPADKDINMGESQRDLVRRIASFSLNLSRSKIGRQTDFFIGAHVCIEGDINEHQVGLPPAVEDFFNPIRLAAVTELVIHRLSSSSTLELLELTPNVVSLCLIPGRPDWLPRSPGTKLLGVTTSHKLLAGVFSDDTIAPYLSFRPPKERMQHTQQFRLSSARRWIYGVWICMFACQASSTPSSV